MIRDIDPLNDLNFFRVRVHNAKETKEIMVAPDKTLFLIVIQEKKNDTLM